MTRKTSLIFLLLVLAAGAALAQPMSGTYYVKKGVSRADTFPSVYAVCQALSSRTTNGNVTVNIFSGYYDEGYMYLYYVNQTRPQDTITIQALPGQDVTVYSTSSYVVYSYYTYNLKLKNLKLLCSSSYGLYMYYAQGWRVENCLIRATSYCVYASSGCNYDSFIGNDLKGGSYTMYLYNSSYAYGHYLANNFIYGWSTYGIYAYYGYYWKLLYNTIIGPGSYGVYAYYQNGDTWKNNILQANTYAVYRYSGSTVPAYSNYNAFWINGGTTSSPVIYSSTYGAQTLAQWQSSSGRDGNSIQQNPQTGGVMNPHLRSSSPCINAGNPWPGITNDIDGDTRSSTTPCIGADEFTTVGSPMSGTYYIKLGTSAADTFPSFEKANADLAVRGQVGNVTFVVFGGIYKENIDLTGLENGPYWVNYIARTSGSPPQPDEVYLQATGSYGITLRGNKRIRFRNLNLVGWTSYGFYLYYKSTTTGGGCDTIVIDGCKVSGGSYPIYAYNYYGGSDDSIMGCELRSTSSYGIYLYGSSSYQNQRNFIANNIITGWTSYGIYAYYQYYPKFIYNTILGTGSYAVYNYYPYGDTWKNNILQAQSYAIYRYYGDNVPAYSNYNCFWLNGGSSSSLVIYSYAYGAQTLAQWQSSSGKDGNSIQLDPLTGGVINPHLRTGSPCINAGNPWPGITKDIDGDTRSSTTPCIGADEYTTVGSPMSGVYTIKQAGGGDFKNFQEAFGQLALRGFGGNVQFDAYDGNYFGMLNFNGIGNGANRLYVRAYPGQNVVVTAGSSYGIYLYNNQRIRIEGITFTGYTSYGCYATSYYTNQNTTDSCAIVGNTFNGASGMYLSYCDWDTIANNTINATSSYGIYIYGYSGAPYSLNNVISGNTITGWTSYGIMAYYQDSLKIIGNTIKSTGSYGIYPNYCNRTRIIGNIIDAGSIAIYEYAGSTTYGNQEVIANNLARGASYGLYTYYLTGAKIINNSFHGSFAWYDYYSYTTTYPESVYNNIFRGMSYAWYKYYGDNVPTGMDYNCFYMGSVGGSIIYHSTYGTLTLTGWRSASGRDANSLDADPLFVSELAPYDLHIQGSSPCKDTSYVFPPFTTDVDGDTRGAPGKKSDIGGDEFYIDIAAASIISPASLIPVGATIQPSAVFKHMGGPRATFYTKMVIRRGATPAYTDSVQVTVNPGDSVIATFANWTPNIVASNYSATAFHLISGDAHPSDDTIVKNFAVGNVDAGMVAILAPPDQAPLGGTIYPQVVVRNYGDFEASCNVRFTITDPTDGDLNSGEVPTDEAAPRLVRKVRLDATVYDTTETVVLAVGAQETLTFTKPWNPAVTGNHSAACRVSLLYDTDPTNDYLSKPFTVERFDFGVTQVVAPTGNVTQNTPVAPSLKIKNYGSSTASCGARVIVLSGTTPVYDQTETGISIPAGGEVTRTFATPWNAAQLGPFTVTAYTLHDYDIDPTNDTAYGSGTVVPSGGGTGNWTCESQMPSGAKPIGDGGWLAYADPLQRLFAARGNKQPDLYAFDPVALGWEPKAPWPNGTEAKPPSKGATSTPYPDPTGKLYVLKGNNTLGFWSYDVNADSWKQLADIPQGTGKKIKGGSDLVYHDGKVYCLKGITNEFLAYDVASDSWQALPAVPAPNPKFDKGSWLCLDEAAGKVYCHQAKYHAFYAYDIAGGTWGAALKGMPTINSLGKKKKSKDGGSGTFRNDNIFAFKGGNTCEFWKYAINGDSWSELTEIPLTGLSGAKKKVKGGGDLVALNPQPNPLIYALKGNKTNEIWKYESFAALSINPRAARSGVMAVTTDNRRLSLSVSPNPLATGFATLSYNLPQPGAATVHVYDAAGRAVLVRSLAVGRTGQVGLDLRSLSAGVYLVKLSTESLTATHKLVVER